MAEFAKAQSEDTLTQDLLNFFETGELPEEVPRLAMVRRLSSTMLVRRVKGTEKSVLLRRDPTDIDAKPTLVVPQSLRKEVMQAAHDSPWAGHVGDDKARRTLRKDYWWPTLKEDIRRHCRQCPQCQLKKRAYTRQQHMKPFHVSEPFQRVAMDLMQMGVDSEDGHKYLMVTREYFTGFHWLHALKTISVKSLNLCQSHGSSSRRRRLPANCRRRLA